MKYEQYPKCSKNNLVTQELNGEILIYDLSENKAFCLNSTAAGVWILSDGSNSVSQIARKLEKEFNSTVTEEFVLLALDCLKKEKLLENDFKLPGDFAGLSRREAVKKAGLGTLAALPVISMLIAPTASHAASVCKAAGSSCTSSSECCSTNTTNVENPPGTIVGTFTGSCCRRESGPYGASNTCVPGNNGDFIPAGFVTYNGTMRTTGGTISCR